MDNFVAIDFETANNVRSSVCSVGLVFVRDGKIVDERYSLIKPYPNYYLFKNTEIHGLTKEDTLDAPTFEEVWEQFEPLVRDLPFVAHNAPFDSSCLIAAHKVYDLYYPNYILLHPASLTPQIAWHIAKPPIAHRSSILRL